MDDRIVDQIDVIAADLANYTRLEIIDLSINIDANLRESPPLGTPVDTGWAKANWIPSVGESVVLDSDKREPTAADVTARASRATKGLNEVLNWKPDDGPIFITNSVPYIGALNAGHSKQSPAGFVQNGIEKGIRETYARAGAKGARDRRAAAYVANKARRV